MDEEKLRPALRALAGRVEPKGDWDAVAREAERRARPRQWRFLRELAARMKGM